VIPEDFIDDGCSSLGKVLEKLFLKLSYDLRPICRAHDHASCTRCHPAGTMTEARKIRVAWEMRESMRELLPWYLDWTAGRVYRVLAFWPGYFDTCSQEVGLYCRHGQPMPEWMKRLAFPEEYAA
jgi:hypothetical protein